MGVRFSLPAPKYIMSETKKSPLLVILGPTAVGKSDLAIKISKWIARKKIGGYKGAEIISADSRQVYRSLNIGTGKITKKEMAGIKHHLLDVADPRQRFSVVDYVRLARKAEADIRVRGKLPIICGGTGFYISALVDGISIHDAPPDRALRETLKRKPAAKLLEMLAKIDLGRAKSMSSGSRNGDDRNPRRLIRAIEIALAENKVRGLSVLVNQPVEIATSAMRSDKQPPRDNYDSLFIGLKVHRDILRSRIHDRLIRRLKQGMITEAKRLHIPPTKGAALSWKRMDELGLEYRYLAYFLKNELTREELIDRLSTKIWQYAKRQMTRFKRDARITWFEPDQKELIEDLVKTFLVNKQ